jgi:L-gulonate 5-dehydrogenase
MKTVGINVPGSLSEFYVVPAPCLYRIPATIPPHIAALGEPFSIGFQAAARGEVEADDYVAIIGAGPIGLATLAAAKLRGAKVAMLDLLDSRLALGEAFGSDLVINSGKENPADVLREWTSGDMPGVVIEAVGSPRTIELAVRLVADGGRVVIEGVTEEAAQLRGVDFTRKELTVHGSRNNLHEFQNAIDYVLANQALVERMVTQVFPLEGTVQAFELADKHPEQVAKIVIVLESDS